MSKITVISNNHMNHYLAGRLMEHEANLVRFSPKTEAVRDFNKGLSIDENRFPKNSEEFKEYESVWLDCYVCGLFAEQEEMKCQ